MGGGSLSDSMNTQTSLKWYYGVSAFAQLPGIIGLILIGVLFGHYRGGFSWGPKLDSLFNYHPLFMTLGMIFFYGDAIMVYRVLRDVNKLVVKIIHATLLLLSLILSSVGLKAVFDSHNKAKPPKPNLNSLHSWLGLTTVVLFGLQWVCGFVTFLFPKLTRGIREAYMPSHKFWGKTILMFALITMTMGMTEYAIYGNLSKGKISYQQDILFAAGFMFLIFIVMIFYVIGDSNFERPHEITDEHVPLTE